MKIKDFHGKVSAGSIHASNEDQISLPADEAGQILGVDYGRADVGLALANFETRMAFGYGKIKNDKELIQKIVEIIAKENVVAAVVGIPSYVNREDVEYDGEKFGKLLAKAAPNLKIEYQNEMFTTKMAQNNLIAKGVKGVKAHDDAEAARIILQEWLDKN